MARAMFAGNLKATSLEFASVFVVGTWTVSFWLKLAWTTLANGGFFLLAWRPGGGAMHSTWIHGSNGWTRLSSRQGTVASTAQRYEQPLPIGLVDLGVPNSFLYFAWKHRMYGVLDGSCSGRRGSVEYGGPEERKRKLLSISPQVVDRSTNSTRAEAFRADVSRRGRVRREDAGIRPPGRIESPAPMCRPLSAPSPQLRVDKAVQKINRKHWQPGIGRTLDSGSCNMQLRHVPHVASASIVWRVRPGAPPRPPTSRRPAARRPAARDRRVCYAVIPEGFT
ncbi:hypothetical protein QBC39DRAFT_29833 [Podospora conica]|nr:hypothetical protein QBC39DRAFT_29833 [Schizothecium conicum]